MIINSSKYIFGINWVIRLGCMFNVSISKDPFYFDATRTMNLSFKKLDAVREYCMLFLLLILLPKTNFLKFPLFLFHNLDLQFND